MKDIGWPFSLSNSPLSFLDQEQSFLLKCGIPNSCFEERDACTPEMAHNKAHLRIHKVKAKLKAQE